MDAAAELHRSPTLVTTNVRHFPMEEVAVQGILVQPG